MKCLLQGIKIFPCTIYFQECLVFTDALNVFQALRCLPLLVKVAERQAGKRNWP